MSTPMVFLHGWGQSRQVWYQQISSFPEAMFLNLPGHGGSAEHDDWIEAIAEQLSDSPSIIVGWSLGGIIAMQLTLKHPEKVRGMALISTTPSFCNRTNRDQTVWNYGCQQQIFDAFESGIKANSAKTMGRFFMLMLQGDTISRSDYNQIALSSIDRGHPPTQATLTKGLNHLASTDLRSDVSSISTPVLLMHGAQDAIIPTAAGAWLAKRLPHPTWQAFEGCGHAPFLTHPETFNETLERWYQTI